jgi:hypothetical protein
MTQRPITLVYTGATANDGTGDSVRSAFTTVNNNFSYITSYTISNVATNNSSIFANTGVRKFVANGIGTFSNVWINLPASASDGQELLLTSLVPISNCFVNQNGQQVLWLSNTAFSTGNVTVRLTYSTSNNHWMTF